MPIIGEFSSGQTHVTTSWYLESTGLGPGPRWQRESARHNAVVVAEGGQNVIALLAGLGAMCSERVRSRMLS
ncbi:uncharacterized protein MYCGRDRAFT_102063 [Zymoseptoria tritici IPO323]|uniref:Uncharacterized protein n=1 Tax=Zymoseptoria tritici (strain CBS 115943 / IPO323) TaxID=336722 RepID=F9WZN0_ZYMTI|nr:uncharacterized protein MYCGRDRAFT_102063 [Zymoseptoria tritici IPO323]EGP92674.1 hypothetical protein MYCGRDRAFT_102063 [Zymoseptoria tritici IPO323]